jgi:hypothetical protein
MGIGGRMFMKYQGSPDPPPRSTDTWLRGAILFVIGLSVLAGLVAWATASPQGVMAVRVYAVIVAGSFILARIKLGWEEDGFAGVYYRCKKPMGSMVVGDEERSPTLTAWFMLGGISVVAANIV